MNEPLKSVTRSVLTPEILHLLEEEARRHPEYADVQNRWGLALLLQGRLKEAQGALEESLRVNPHFGWAVLNLVQCLAVTGQVDQARKVWSHGREPSAGARAYVAAFLELAAGCLSEGEAQLEPLVPALRERPDFLFLRAALCRPHDPAAADRFENDARRRLGADIPETIARCAPGGATPPLLNLIPGRHQLWMEISSLEARLGRIEQAERAAALAFTAWSERGALLIQRGLLASLGEDEERAVPLYQEAARVLPADPAPHVALAYHWSATGRLARARQAVREALKRAPDYADMHYQLGLLEREREDHAAALEAFARAIACNPEYRAARLNLAATQFDLGRWEEARDSYLEVLESGLSSSDIHLQLGRAQEALGCGDEAETNYREALRLNPEDPDAHFLLGRLLRDRGDIEAAEQSWERFLKLSTDRRRTAEVRNLLGKPGD